MKITRQQLKQIIKEELSKVLNEGEPPPFPQNIYTDPTGPMFPMRHRQAGEDPITYEGLPTDIYGNIKQPGVDYTDPRLARAPTEAGRQGLRDPRNVSTYQGATTMAFEPERTFPGQELGRISQRGVGVDPDRPGQFYSVRDSAWREYPTGIPTPGDYRGYVDRPKHPEFRQFRQEAENEAEAAAMDLADAVEDQAYDIVDAIYPRHLRGDDQ
jgi:hypothetical protein